MFPYPISYLATAESGLAQLDNGFYMDFNGADDYVDTANIIAGTGDISASFWCKTTHSGPLQPKYPISLYGATSITHSIGHTGQLWTSVERFAQVGATKGTVQLNDGDWHHLVWTREMPSGDVKVYVDGNTTPDVTGTYTGNYGGLNHDTLLIGGIRNSLGNFQYMWPGDIDEVAYWNRVLTSTEAEEIYNATETGKCADLNDLSGGAPTAWYRMGD